MAEVDTSIYRNQPNPLGTAAGVFNLLNTAQQNQLLQTAIQQRQLELQQGFANDVRSTLAPLANRPDVTQEEVKAAIASRARMLGPGGQAIYNTFSQRYSGPDWRKNLTIDAIGAIGAEGITGRTGITSASGQTGSIPSVQGVGTNYLSTGVPLTTGPSAAKMQSDLINAGNYSTNIVPWIQMHHELSALPEGSTGPLTTGLLHTVEGIHSLAPGLLKYLPGVSAENMTNRAAFAKYAAQAANNIGGRGTDLSLMQTITGNPNPQINDLTDKQLIKMGIAVMRMGAAQTLEASRADIRDNQGKLINKGEIGSNAPEYISKSAKIASQMDPRGFMFDLLSPEERTKLDKSMKDKTERRKFNYSVHLAREHQFLSLPEQ